jgi:hypothetical protein
MRFGEGPAAQLGAVFLAAFILRGRLAIKALGLPDRPDVAQRFRFVAPAAHQLVGLAPVEGEGCGMLSKLMSDVQPLTQQTPFCFSKSAPYSGAVR